MIQFYNLSIHVYLIMLHILLQLLFIDISYLTKMLLHFILLYKIKKERHLNSSKHDVSSQLVSLFVVALRPGNIYSHLWIGSLLMTV